MTSADDSLNDAVSSHPANPPYIFLAIGTSYLCPPLASSFRISTIAFSFCLSVRICMSACVCVCVSYGLCRHFLSRRRWPLLADNKLCSVGRAAVSLNAVRPGSRVNNKDDCCQTQTRLARRCRDSGPFGFSSPVNICLYDDRIEHTVTTRRAMHAVLTLRYI